MAEEKEYKMVVSIPVSGYANTPALAVKATSLKEAEEKAKQLVAGIGHSVQTTLNIDYAHVIDTWKCSEEKEKEIDGRVR